MTPLALPDDWTEEEATLVRRLVACGTHSVEVVDDQAWRLVATDWMTLWTDDGITIVTFTPLGAAALGLTLDGDPARWMTRAQSRKLDEGPTKAPRAPGKVVTETDLNASRERAGKPRQVVGDAAENRRVDASDGWRPANHGGMSKPAFLLTEGLRGMDDWNGPLAGPCPVCGPRGGLGAGEYCCRCDGSWQDRVRKPGARRRAG